MNHQSQAQHNEQLCDYLKSDGRWNDWVITTAFYSAYHFILPKLFPCTIGTSNFRSLDEYLAGRKEDDKFGRHGAMLRLTARFLPGASEAYDWLHSACVNSRYKNYDVKPAKAAKARQHLTTVKMNCTAATSGKAATTEAQVATQPVG